MPSLGPMFDLLIGNDLLRDIGFKLCTTCEVTKRTSCFKRKGRNTQTLVGKCRPCEKAYSEITRPRYRTQKNASGRAARASLRIEVLSHYSPNPFYPECACCGEARLEFLALDHIHGGGNKHKQAVRHVFKWAKVNNYPEMFRVLCHNCNQSLGAYGYCPHTQEAQNRTVANL